MKRNMELIRKLVLMLEADPSGLGAKYYKVDGFTREEVNYHAFLLVEQKLAVGSKDTSQSSKNPEASLTRLTWEGHEFADAIRDDTRWNKAMELVKEHAGSVTIEILKAVLSMLMKTALGLS